MSKDAYSGKYVVGERPTHEHTDTSGKPWPCNSPYCEVIKGVDPPPDGPPVVLQGQEPWRGR